MLYIILLLVTDMFVSSICIICRFFFFQAEDGIRDLVRSRGLGDVYKRQVQHRRPAQPNIVGLLAEVVHHLKGVVKIVLVAYALSLIHI